MSFRHLTGNRLAAVALFTGLWITASSAALFAQNNDPTFGSRIDRPDGSAALTIGRRLPTEWDTKLGMDARLAPDTGSSGIADALLQGAATNRSSGAVWGNLTGPGVALWDKTAVEARIDPGQEHGQVITTMSRTLPLNEHVSVTVQDKYSVTQTLAGGAMTSQKVQTNPSGGALWEADRSLRFNLAPTGTTLSAGVATSNTDNQWHNKLTAEQQIAGPLSVTTSVTDPATATSSKSISARYKHTW